MYDAVHCRRVFRDFLLGKGEVNMNPAVQGIYHTAVKHSRRATKLWMESAAIINREADNPTRKAAAMRKAAELSEKALDEYRQALHSMEFLRRYRQTEN